MFFRDLKYYRSLLVEVGVNSWLVSDIWSFVLSFFCSGFSGFMDNFVVVF